MERDREAEAGVRGFPALEKERIENPETKKPVPENRRRAESTQ